MPEVTGPIILSFLQTLKGPQLGDQAAPPAARQDQA
jgi:hypothetical protein